MMCRLDGASTSTSSWVVVRKKTSEYLFTWWPRGDPVGMIFSASFQFSSTCLLGISSLLVIFAYIACGAQNVSWVVKPHWNFKSACCWDRQSDLLCMKGGGGGRSDALKKRHALSQMSKQLVTQPVPPNSLAYTPTHLVGSWTVTETTSMEESDGTNLKPISPNTFFFKQDYENMEVLVLCLVSWRERPQSTSIPPRRKVF
jgi:hypothetical protein